MRAIATWLAERRARRIVVIAALFPLPFVGLFSAATVVMSAELRGARAAAIDCGFALLMLLGIGYIAGMQITVLAVSALLSWTIWIALGALVRWSTSLTLAVQAATVVALLALAAVFLFVPEPAAVWTGVLEQFYADLGTQGVDVAADIERQSALMSGIVAAASLCGALLALLLGTWWSSFVGHADFGASFRSLRLGYAIGGLAALAGLLELIGVETGGVLLIFGAAFAFQGAAVIAWWSHALNWPRAWWLALVVLPLILLPVLVLELALFAALGFVDNWYDLRRKRGA